MKGHSPDPNDFLTEVSKLALQFAWPTRSFERDGEVVLVALTQTDPLFERFVWVYDTERVTVRCMLVTKEKVDAQKYPPILELCALINQGLPFGCLEYSFDDKVLVFRDSSDLDWGPLDKIVGGTTSRVLNLGRKYAATIKLVIEGESPQSAVKKAEERG